MTDSHWSDSPLEEFEYPDEADQDGPDQSDDSDDWDTIPCPECGESIYEDTPSCPYCGHYITFSTNLWSNQSPVWIGVGMLGILAVIIILVLG